VAEREREKKDILGCRTPDDYPKRNMVRKDSELPQAANESFTVLNERNQDV